MVCGLCILLGMATTITVVPLLGVVAVAFVTTKMPILFGRVVWRFSLKAPPRHGFLRELHQARTDLARIEALLFILVMGSDPLSTEERRRRRTPPAQL
jgi:uncharacterized membrane protein YphA (DoxX/SURF4 family)